jgi:excisionase family DNA binding protein
MDNHQPVTAPRFVSPYLTVEEAGEYIRRSASAIYALVKRGRLVPMPGSPGRLLFRREHLDKFLESPPRRRQEKWLRQEPPPTNEAV